MPTKFEELKAIVAGMLDDKIGHAASLMEAAVNRMKVGDYGAAAAMVNELGQFKLTDFQLRVCDLSTEAKQEPAKVVEPVEPEWPKWWRYQGGVCCANSEDDWGTFYDVESHYSPRVTKCGLKMAAHAKHYEFKPITATEAAKILGKEVA